MSENGCCTYILTENFEVLEAHIMLIDRHS